MVGIGFSDTSPTNSLPFSQSTKYKYIFAKYRGTKSLLIRIIDIIIVKCNLSRCLTKEKFFLAILLFFRLRWGYFLKPTMWQKGVRRTEAFNVRQKRKYDTNSSRTSFIIVGLNGKTWHWTCNVQKWKYNENMIKIYTTHLLEGWSSSPSPDSCCKQVFLRPKLCKLLLISNCCHRAWYVFVSLNAIVWARY